MRHALNTQRGVTLIELMIGIAIGVLVVLAAMSLLLNMTHASARVAQTQDVSDAMRSSVGLVGRAVAEAGFGISDVAAHVSITPALVLRSRMLPEPMQPLAAGEIRVCTFRIDSPANADPILVRQCDGGAAETVVQGAVAFEAHSGCSAATTTRVARYRLGNCIAGETRRSVRIAILVRANAPDPVPDRLVADDTYTLPATVDTPGGTIYTVPTGTAGAANGCDVAGECRSYKHRLLVTEVIPRNELIRARVAF